MCPVPFFFSPSCPRFNPAFSFLPFFQYLELGSIVPRVVKCKRGGTSVKLWDETAESLSQIHPFLQGRRLSKLERTQGLVKYVEIEPTWLKQKQQQKQQQSGPVPLSLFALLQVDKEMAENGRVHSDCVNASNPYHECGVACLEKIAQGQGRKEKKKSDIHIGIKEGELSKKMNGERRSHTTCPKASNPYHHCDVFCSQNNPEAKPWEVKNESGSFIFGGKKKGSESQPTTPRVSQPNTPRAASQFTTPRAVNNVSTVKTVHSADKLSPTSRAVNNVSAVKGVHSGDRLSPTPRAVNSVSAVKGVHSADNLSPTSGAVNSVAAVKAVYSADTVSPRPPFPTQKEIESENSRSSSSSQEASDSQENSFEKEKLQSAEPVPKSGNVTANGTPRGSFIGFGIAATTKQEENERLQALPKATPPPMVKGEAEIHSGPIFPYMKFSYSGISRASEWSDDEEAESVISDSCVSVGKYHVRANVAPVLRSIIDKHGDIAANCRLQSASMRGHFLECLCSVVQELRSTPFKQLTRSKIKEFLAVLKDVESIGIDVSWLHGILDELTEAIEVNHQHQAAEITKANCDGSIESTKREIESLMEELTEKEKAVTDTKARIEDARARLSDLELESSQLTETISSIKSKVETYNSKSFADKIL